MLVAIRGLAAAGVAGLALLATSLDLGRPVPNDPVVELEDEPRLADSPLSPDEAEALRSRADPEQLRCVPRGCELWRHELQRGQDPNSGVVLLDNGLLVLHGGNTDSTRMNDDGTLQSGWGPRLMAIDPATGAEAWTRQVIFEGGERNLWVRLTSGPHGIVVLAGTHVASIDEDGEVVWQWRPGEEERTSGEVWGYEQFDDVVVLDGWQDSSTGHGRRLTALDAASGEQLWSRESEVAALLPDAVIVTDDDGWVERLDPLDGTAVWRGPRVDTQWFSYGERWLIAHREDGRQLVIDLDTGRRLGEIDGWLTSALMPGGDDGYLAIIRTDALENDDAYGFEDEAGELALLYLRADGTTMWSAPLGTHTPWWECCRLAVDEDLDAVIVQNGDVSLGFDQATGEQLPEAQLPADDAEGWHPAESWEAAPGLRVLWGEDGREVSLLTDGGEVTIRSRHHVNVSSTDPVVVSDADHVMGIRLPVADGD